MAPLGTSVPRYTSEMTLTEFPTAVSVDPVAPARPSPAELAKPISLQFPFELDSSRTRVRNGGVDLSYKLVRHDGVRPTTEYTVGRTHVPSIAPIAWRTASAVVRQFIHLAPVAAALSADVPDRDVQTATAAIKVLFPQAPQGNESISFLSRDVIRNFVGAGFVPDRFVWRLAALYVAAKWCAANDAQMFTGQLDLAEATQLQTVGDYDALLSGWDLGVQAVAARFDGFSDQAGPLLNVLRLAASQRPLLSTTNGVELPTVARFWPPIGRTRVIYLGPILTGLGNMGALSPELIWEAASLWCSQHGVMQMLHNMVGTVSMLWFSTRAGLAPLFQSDRITLALPECQMAACALIPISQSYVAWRDEFHTVDEPATHLLFHKAAVYSMLVGLGFRTWAYQAGMPYVQWLSHTAAEQSHIFAEARGTAVGVGAMVQTQAILTSLGASGTLGGILLSASPAWKDVPAMKKWWVQHSSAYQWEEVGNVLTKLPRCSALHGIIVPMKTSKVLAPGVWYRPGVLADVAAKRRSVEEALQGLAYLPDVGLAWRITDGHSGTTEVHAFTRAMNYRNVASDWQFADRFTRDFLSAEIAFRIGSIESALVAHTGPAGQVPWKWYVTRPLLPEEDMPSDDEFVHYGPTMHGPRGVATQPPGQVGPTPLMVHEEDDAPHGPQGRGQPPAEGASGTQRPHMAEGGVAASSRTDTYQEPTPHEGLPGSEAWRAAGERARHLALPSAMRGKVRALLATFRGTGREVPSWLDCWSHLVERSEYVDAGADPNAPWEVPPAKLEAEMRGAAATATASMNLPEFDASLKSLPPGQRAAVAAAASDLAQWAAPLIGNASAANAAACTAVKLGAKSAALATCPAMAAEELLDYMTSSQINAAGARLTDANITRALNAGVSARELAPRPGRNARTTNVSKATRLRLEDNGEVSDEAVTMTFSRALEEAFYNGAISEANVVEWLGFRPRWIEARIGQPLEGFARRAHNEAFAGLQMDPREAAGLATTAYYESAQTPNISEALRQAGTAAASGSGTAPATSAAPTLASSASLAAPVVEENVGRGNTSLADMRAGASAAMGVQLRATTVQDAEEELVEEEDFGQPTGEPSAAASGGQSSAAASQPTAAVEQTAPEETGTATPTAEPSSATATQQPTPSTTGSLPVAHFQ